MKTVLRLIISFLTLSYLLMKYLFLDFDPEAGSDEEQPIPAAIR